MKDMAVSDTFMQCGVCELACSSTSENLGIIAEHSRSACPMLLRLRVDSPIALGANISWLSTLPREEEWLYPPLAYLKPTYKQRIKGRKKGRGDYN